MSFLPGLSALNNASQSSLDIGSGTGHEVHHYENISDELRTIYYPRPATLAAATFAIIFMVFGVFGNLVTILALGRSQKLRMHATTWFVLSLCVSDLIFCAFNLPLTASRFIHEAWVLSKTFCRLFPFIFYGNVATSLMSMVAITINRYVLISHYTLYDRIYRWNHILAMLGFVWMFSFSILIPPLLEVWGRLGLDRPTFSCTILKKDGKSPKKFLFIFGILIPCLVIIFCYTCIFLKVRQSRLNVMTHRCGPQQETEKQMSASQRRDDLRLTKMMLLIFCCFLLCFLPLLIFNVADDDVKLPTLHILASILAWASSVINPIIYALTNKQYRLAYNELFCRAQRPERQSRTLSRSGSGRTVQTEMISLNNAAPEKTKISNGRANGKVKELIANVGV